MAYRVRHDLMRVELTSDEDATRALHQPILRFQVRLDEGEKMTMERRTTTEFMAREASMAWDAIHREPWTGVMQ